MNTPLAENGIVMFGTGFAKREGIDAEQPQIQITYKEKDYA